MPLIGPLMEREDTTESTTGNCQSFRLAPIWRSSITERELRQLSTLAGAIHACCSFWEWIGRERAAKLPSKRLGCSIFRASKRSFLWSVARSRAQNLNLSQRSALSASGRLKGGLV